MRHAPKPSISQHRLSRLALWAGLWLARLAALLLGEGREAAHVIERAFASLDKLVRMLIYARLVLAFPRLRLPNIPWPRRVLVAERRALFGSAVRRVMRGRTLGERIGRLRETASRIDAIVKRLLHRLRRGLTRRRPRQWRPDRAPVLTFFAPTPRAADTS